VGTLVNLSLPLIAFGASFQVGVEAALVRHEG